MPEDDAVDTTPLDTIEAENGMRNLARLTRVFFDELASEGFEPQSALYLTREWLVATIENSG